MTSSCVTDFCRRNPRFQDGRHCGKSAAELIKFYAARRPLSYLLKPIGRSIRKRGRSQSGSYRIPAVRIPADADPEWKPQSGIQDECAAIASGSCDGWKRELWAHAPATRMQMLIWTGSLLSVRRSEPGNQRLAASNYANDDQRPLRQWLQICPKSP